MNVCWLVIIYLRAYMFLLVNIYIYCWCIYMLLLVNIYVCWCIYVVVGDDICNVHICCWYSSFMLLVMNMLVWTCVFAWNTFCCGRVLVHTRCSCLSYPIVVVEYFGILYAGCYAGCYGVFISVRGDGLGDERSLVPHLVELSSHITCF